MPKPIIGQSITTTKLNLPDDVCHQISLRAAQIVRSAAPKGENSSYRLIRETYRQNEIGIHIPPDAIHLLYLDQGIKPFLMKELEGKTIPIRGPNGVINFRRAKDVGKPKIISRDESGKIVSSKLRWRYPGVAAMNFIKPSIIQAVDEWASALTINDLINIMRRLPSARRVFRSSQ